jgi:N-acyl-D-amino-acid deacylase
LLRTGYWADIAIWDAATISDTATYTAPHQYPVGIAAVIVNGIIVLNERGEQLGNLPGRVLRHHERSGSVR